MTTLGLDCLGLGVGLEGEGVSDGVFDGSVAGLLVDLFGSNIDGSSRLATRDVPRNLSAKERSPCPIGPMSRA